MKPAAPLDDVSVLEIGTAIAGPLCGAILAEMGAKVIKVEHPTRGDDARHFGKIVKGESLYFFNYNRNKLSLAVDIKKKEGLAIVKKLIREVDVLIENYRPGTLSKLGLSYEQVKHLNNRIIYCSISGFGSRGFYRDYKGYDVVVQAMSGLMWMNREPGAEPMRLPAPLTDILAAYSAAAAVCAALHLRERLKKAVKIDASLLQMGLAAVSQWLVDTWVTKEEVKPFGNKYPALAPYEPFRTKDGWIVVAVGNDEQWLSLCRATGRSDLMEDMRFRTNQDRIKPHNRSYLAAELQKTLGERTSKEWVTLFQEEGIPAGPVYSLTDVLNDENLSSLGLFSPTRHPTIGEVLAVRLTAFFQGFTTHQRPAPRLGEHTENILKELGYSRRKIQELADRGVVKTFSETT
ncbi:MAG: CoA transferase [Candidatus Caldarchaeum sp.]